MTDRKPEDHAQPVFAYLHIPKTGGSSFLELAYLHYRLSGQEPEDKSGAYINGVVYTDRVTWPGGFFTIPAEACAEISDIERAAPVRAVVGHFTYGIHRFLAGECTYVTILRDPIERILSLASHFRKWDYGYLKDAKYRPYIEIGRSEGADFVDVLRRHALPEFSNDQARRVAGLDLPFGAFEGAERLVETSLRNIAIVGLTERFNETLVLLSDRLGWDSVSSYSRKLTNDERLRSDELSARDLDWLRSINQVDLRLYERAVGRFEAAISGLSPEARSRAAKIEGRRWDAS
jgi:hypothetical protein